MCSDNAYLHKSDIRYSPVKPGMDKGGEGGVASCVYQRATCLSIFIVFIAFRRFPVNRFFFIFRNLISYVLQHVLNFLQFHAFQFND